MTQVSTGVAGHMSWLVKGTRTTSAQSAGIATRTSSGAVMTQSAYTQTANMMASWATPGADGCHLRARSIVLRGWKDRSRRWKAATTASLAGVMRWLGDVGRLVGSGIDMRRRRRANGAIAIRDTDARGTDVCEDMVARAATVAAAGGRAAVGY